MLKYIKEYMMMCKKLKWLWSNQKKRIQTYLLQIKNSQKLTDNIFYIEVPGYLLQKYIYWKINT